MNTVILRMGQPKETNLPERLQDPYVEPQLADADNDYETQLDLDELSARRERYARESEDPVDKVAAEICRLLRIPEAA